MKRTDLVFKSEGKEVRANIEDLKLNSLIDLMTEDVIQYRVIKGREYYGVDREEWESLEKIYGELLDKEIVKTRSYEIPTKNSTSFCHINEDDYCSIVRKIDLDTYRETGKLDYTYFVESKSIVSKEDMEFEIDREIYEKLRAMDGF